jgi:hypothetical protein
MKKYRLRIETESDATFGRGDGVAGLVDAEVQHDRYGLPYLGGRALKGLLGAECADVLFALGHAQPQDSHRWQSAEQRLFGRSGGALEGQANMIVGPARLPADLRAAVARDVREGNLSPNEVLESLTALRRQTAMDPTTGAPRKETLRTMRVILRQTPFEAQLTFRDEPSADELALLAACVKALRRAGTGRNRGRGRLSAEMLDEDGQNVTEQEFEHFRKAVRP